MVSLLGFEFLLLTKTGDNPENFQCERSYNFFTNGDVTSFIAVNGLSKMEVMTF